MNRFIIRNNLFKYFDYVPIRTTKQRRPHVSHPALWYEDYPISLIGTRQSPINIKKEKCIRNHQKLELPPLQIQYPPIFNGLRIRNPKDDTYFGWRVDVPYDFGDQAIIAGGPLNHRYKLIQFHAHWGKDCNCGSEHIIDGKPYSAELHFVHWNFDLYSSARKAAVSKDGLTVIAVFLQISPDAKPLSSLHKICNEIPNIKYKGSMKEMKQPMNIMEMIPKNRSYFTYLGSLTTPPLWETVTWIIFEEPIYCTKEQLDAFRMISYYQKESLQQQQQQKHRHHHKNSLDEIYNVTTVQENFRPVQPLNGRQIIHVRK
ncbi:Phospholipase A2 crotoxin acid subunit CA [Dermatophagoides farinae]|uniref:Carbonic anhydrase n=1 Tax=Dermatophagoides farinae TaxID=6954 RepID=A0A922LCR1_DERFA|nr:carbonic anhydrase 7-like [Dermatophagoides farinae]KAH7641188.1 carbonic anhydrase 2-like protein [Dermatophagoides farinae]KAH9526915.1 Phospholipase A2 crotoxin acid subunit CA [Dermatophagoides farinae]